MKTPASCWLKGGLVVFPSRPLLPPEVRGSRSLTLLKGLFKTTETYSGLRTSLIFLLMEALIWEVSLQLRIFNQKISGLWECQDHHKTRQVCKMRGPSPGPLRNQPCLLPPPDSQHLMESTHRTPGQLSRRSRGQQPGQRQPATELPLPLRPGPADSDPEEIKGCEMTDLSET